MPHKKNPILSENLTGLARLIRSSVILLWKILLYGMKGTSHSAVERNIGPDATITLDFGIGEIN